MPDQPLHVAVDARCLNRGHLRGMGKSLFELIRRTADTGAIHWHLLADRPDLPMQVPAESADVELFDTRGHRFRAWEQWSLPDRAKKIGVDLLHAPATSMPWWQPVPTVVTVHDTIPWQHQDPAWPAGFYLDRLLPAAYHRAAAIMTVSDCSRRDILARWPQLQPKLHVVRPGVDERYLEVYPDFRPVVIDGKPVREPYLLYVGGADPRKRLMWALQTWWGTSSNGTSMVVCGLEPDAHEQIRRTVPHNLRDRLHLAPFIDENEMPRLYMKSAAVLYPSLYEGFGLPVIEAQAVGTPVLFSDVGSLTELKGPGAIVLPVDDMTAWVRTVNTIVLSRREPRPDRVARAWAGQYSWDAYVKRTLAVYQAVREAGNAPDPHAQRQGATP